MRRTALSIKSIVIIIDIETNDGVRVFNERQLRHVDLNLLVTFLVLMRERSVSRAAACLFIGQPAASAALARLREQFGDELLVRTAAGMVPTQRALALEAALGPLVTQMQETLFAAGGFDPASAQHTFTLGMPDWVEIWLLPRLFERVRTQAPGIRLAIKASDPFSFTRMLEDDAIDVAIGPAVQGPRWQKTRTLRTLAFRCLYNRRLTRIAGKLTLARYVAQPHVLVSYRAVFDSAADALLAEQGLRREVLLTTPRFATLPAILRTSRAIATVPEVLAERWADDTLAAAAVPFALPGFTAMAAWHTRRDSDPALAWLLDQIAAAAQDAD
ncbi:LysR family transcriptional regulator [Pseudoduganella armeniaca]|uniref:LysR family transcriptional regulator n=1 Tax=Pseudoduganella armeniaca TaxID=2072590 RepID=A0A2R4CHS6_9BURK|nr:LysR family transcriptional regulator [Pseudoduganella armeniaca]